MVYSFLIRKVIQEKDIFIENNFCFLLHSTWIVQWFNEIVSRIHRKKSKYKLYKYDSEYLESQ